MPLKMAGPVRHYRTSIMSLWCWEEASYQIYHSKYRNALLTTPFLSHQFHDTHLWSFTETMTTEAFWWHVVLSRQISIFWCVYTPYCSSDSFTLVVVMASQGYARFWFVVMIDVYPCTTVAPRNYALNKPLFRPFLGGYHPEFQRLSKF